MLYDVTNSLVILIVPFDILKLKFDFIGGELWFVKVKRFKMKERTTTQESLLYIYRQGAISESKRDIIEPSGFQQNVRRSS